jgi:anti-sigma regulatory factor (Ser/Thr protein kinase)
MSTRSRSFRSAPEATADARRFVRASLPRRLTWINVDDAVLLADELVSNAVRHSATTEPIKLSVTVRDTTVRVTVTDAGEGFDPMTEPAATRSAGVGGWGLELVASLAARWGVDRDDDHTTVWFEIDGTSSDGT